jgi:hypothetical protein
VEPLAGGPVQPDVLPGSVDRELVAAGRQLPDQITQRLIKGVAAGLGPQRPDQFLGQVVPVQEEATGMRIQKQVPGQVQRQPVLVEDTVQAFQIVADQKNTSATPRLRSSVSAAIQNFADAS